jgi:hypothetical protein
LHVELAHVNNDLASLRQALLDQLAGRLAGLVIIGADIAEPLAAGGQVCVIRGICSATLLRNSAWFTASLGLMAMPLTPLASMSSTIPRCSAAVPRGGMWNSTRTFKSSAAFSVPRWAMVQNS